MADPVPLPDPTIEGAQPQCIDCGYALHGLTPPSLCPECGTLYSGVQLTLHGVPTAQSVMPSWRVVLLVLSCLIAMFSAQILFLAFFRFGWIGPVMFAASGVAFIAWFMTTTPRGSRGGATRFVFTGGMAAFHPVKTLPADTEVHATIAFDGSEQVHLNRVGPVWAKLRIHRPSAPGSRGRTLLRAGIRCPIELESMVLDRIHATIAEALDHPPSGPAVPDESQPPDQPPP